MSPNPVDVEFHWWSAFIVLAVRRCRPYFKEMGIPDAITQQPAAIDASSRCYVRTYHDAYRSDVSDDRFVAVMEAARRDAFDQVRAAYGEREAEALQAWMHHRFVDRDEAYDWWCWGVLFPKLADAWGNGPPAVASPLAADALARFESLVRRHYSWDEEEAFDAEMEVLEQQALDADERTWLTDTGGEFSAFDVVKVQRVVKDDRAYRIWHELVEVMDQASIVALVEWGHEVSKHTGVLMPDHVRLPPLMQARLEAKRNQ